MAALEAGEWAKAYKDTHVTCSFSLLNNCLSRGVVGSLFPSTQSYCFLRWLGAIMCSAPKANNIERGRALLTQPQDSPSVGFPCPLTASYAKAFTSQTHQVRTETSWVSGLLFHWPSFRSREAPYGDVCVPGKHEALGAVLGLAMTWLVCHQRPLERKDQNQA